MTSFFVCLSKNSFTADLIQNNRGGKEVTPPPYGKAALANRRNRTDARSEGSAIPCFYFFFHNHYQ